MTILMIVVIMVYDDDCEGDDANDDCDDDGTDANDDDGNDANDDCAAFLRNFTTNTSIKNCSKPLTKGTHADA